MLPKSKYHSNYVILPGVGEIFSQIPLEGNDFHSSPKSCELWDWTGFLLRDWYSEMLFLPHLPPADYAMTRLMSLPLLQQPSEGEGLLIDEQHMAVWQAELLRRLSWDNSAPADGTVVPSDHDKVSWLGGRGCGLLGYFITINHFADL